jgi:hypothetical protein
MGRAPVARPHPLGALPSSLSSDIEMPKSESLSSRFLFAKLMRSVCGDPVGRPDGCVTESAPLASHAVEIDLPSLHYP